MMRYKKKGKLFGVVGWWWSVGAGGVGAVLVGFDVRDDFLYSIYKIRRIDGQKYFLRNLNELPALRSGRVICNSNIHTTH